VKAFRAAHHRLAADGYDLAADGYDLAADGYDNQVPGTRISHPDIKNRISEIAGLDAQTGRFDRLAISHFLEAPMHAMP
jgi:aspartyl-tRNA synthetase